MRYIYGQRGHNRQVQKIGMFLAVADSRGFYRAGWSIMNPNDGRFQRDRAIFAAMSKLSVRGEEVPTFPPYLNRRLLLEAEWNKFLDDCDLYYKVKG